MKRRDFLKSAAAVPASIIVGDLISADEVKLVAPTVAREIPAAVMPSFKAILTPTMIARESLRLLKSHINIEAYHTPDHVKLGDKVRIRLPSGRELEALIDKRKHVSWHHHAADLTLSLDEYSQRYLVPAMIAMRMAMCHGGAPAIATVKLACPESAIFSANAAYKGMAVRVVKDYCIDQDEEIMRLDTMYGHLS